MRWYLCALLVLLVPAVASAQRVKVDRVDIIEFGVYSAVVESVRRSDTTAMGHVSSLTDIKLRSKTDTVCARLGERFGIRYVVVGQPRGMAVELDWVTRFPPPGAVNARGKQFAVSELKDTKMIGDEAFRSYTFEEEWEMVPGVWSLEFHYKGRKVGEKTFTVLASCSPIS